MCSWIKTYFYAFYTLRLFPVILVLYCVSTSVVWDAMKHSGVSPPAPRHFWFKWKSNSPYTYHTKWYRSYLERFYDRRSRPQTSGLRLFDAPNDPCRTLNQPSSSSTKRATIGPPLRPPNPFIIRQMSAQLPLNSFFELIVSCVKQSIKSHYPLVHYVSLLSSTQLGYEFL